MAITYKFDLLGDSISHITREHWKRLIDQETQRYMRKILKDNKLGFPTCVIAKIYLTRLCRIIYKYVDVHRSANKGATPKYIKVVLYGHNSRLFHTLIYRRMFIWKGKKLRPYNRGDYVL